MKHVVLSIYINIYFHLFTVLSCNLILNLCEKGEDDEAMLFFNFGCHFLKEDYRKQLLNCMKNKLAW